MSTFTLDSASAAVDLRTAPVDVRRHFLREAAELGDAPGSALRAAVRIAAPDLTAAARDAAWEELVLDVARLADLGVGLEWREVVPGAPPSQGYTIATEVLELAIAEHLAELVPAVTA